MTNQTRHRSQTGLISGLFAILLGVGGYTFSAQAEAIREISKVQQAQGERLAVLETIADQNRQMITELRIIARELANRDDK